jgi:hypothetical protein
MKMPQNLDVLLWVIVCEVHVVRLDIFFRDDRIKAGYGSKLSLISSPVG